MHPALQKLQKGKLQRLTPRRTSSAPTTPLKAAMTQVQRTLPELHVAAIAVI